MAGCRSSTTQDRICYSEAHILDLQHRIQIMPRLRKSCLFIFISLSILTACGPAPRPPEPDNLFWPLPPEPPRIKYIRSIYSEDDIGRVYSFMEKLFGKDYFDRLIRPYGIFARYDKIAVADIVLRRVLLFDLGLKRLKIIGVEGAIQMPSSVALDRSGTIYVSDVQGGKVIVYDPNGKYKTAFLLKNSRPAAITLDEERARLYVADTAGHRIVVFGLDGKMLFDFGGWGKEKGRFNHPIDVALDRAGNIYVLDARNFRVQIFDPNGTFITAFGAVGNSPGFFANPKGIEVDTDGHIYVTDAAFSNFQVFNKEGHPLIYIGSLGPGHGEMHLPAGISIDENDRIYIADQLNSRVQVFQYLRQ